MLPLYEKDLFDHIEYLAKQHGFKNISELCAASGASRGSLTDLKMGRKKTLSTNTLSKIANCLNLSIDEVGGRTEPQAQKKEPILTQKDERDIARDLEALRQSLESGDSLMFDGNPMSKEARESILQAMELGLRVAKQMNKETYTPKKYRKD